MKTLLGIIILILAATNMTNAQIASNGNYTLTQTAIANGGASGNGASLGGTYSIEGTIGQSAAGTNQQNAIYNFKPGFWTAQPLVVTAASVSLGGRVTTADGRGIRNVLITLTETDGTIRTVSTATFGYYRFDEVSAGQTVILTLRAKRFTFVEPTLVLSVTQDVTDLNFTAFEQNLNGEK